MSALVSGALSAAAGAVKVARRATGLERCCDVPGDRSGWVGAQNSLRFGRDPEGFVRENVDLYGPTFHSLLLNEETVFVTSYEDVAAALDSRALSHAAGYGDLMGRLYEPCVLLSDDEAQVAATRAALQAALARVDLAAALGGAVRRHVAAWAGALELPMYEGAKALAAEAVSLLFLGVPPDAALTDARDQFWRAMVSVPLSVSLPGFRSQFSRGAAAKEALLAHADAQLASAAAQGCPAAMARQEGLSREDARNHLLLFSSSLVVKALAALLTAFAQFMADPAHAAARARAAAEALLVDDEALVRDPARAAPFIHAALLEAGRLAPPVIGCMRGADGGPAEVGGLPVPAGHKVWCFFLAANRDPAAYEDPLAFRPERWLADPPPPPHFSFGRGARECLGKALSSGLASLVAAHMLRALEWEVMPGQDTAMRWLPVSRPVDGLRVRCWPSGNN